MLVGFAWFLPTAPFVFVSVTLSVSDSVGFDSSSSGGEQSSPGQGYGQCLPLEKVDGFGLGCEDDGVGAVEMRGTVTSVEGTEEAVFEGIGSSSRDGLEAGFSDVGFAGLLEGVANVPRDADVMDALR